MHATMWLIGCRPKALYFSHAQGRAPSKEIEDQKYGHTISFSFPRDVHAEDTELNFISGKDQRHARGAAHIHSSPVKAEKRKQRVGKMRGIYLGVLIVLPHQLVHYSLYLCALYLHNLTSLHLRACVNKMATVVLHNVVSARADLAGSKKQTAFGQVLKKWAICGKRIISHL